MNRRRYLESICLSLSAATAGCSSDVEVEGNENGNGGDEETAAETSTEEASVEDYVKILDHDFESPQVGSGILMSVTVENVSDQKIGLLEVDGSLFVENERVDDAGFSTSDLGPGIQETDDMGLVDAIQYIEDITHYTISLSFRADGERWEDTYEFDDFEYP